MLDWFRIRGPIQLLNSMLFRSKLSKLKLGLGGLGNKISD